MPGLRKPQWLQNTANHSVISAYHAFYLHCLPRPKLTCGKTCLFAPTGAGGLWLWCSRICIEPSYCPRNKYDMNLQLFATVIWPQDFWVSSAHQPGPVWLCSGAPSTYARAVLEGRFSSHLKQTFLDCERCISRHPCCDNANVRHGSLISGLNHRSPIFGEDTWPQYPPHGWSHRRFYVQRQCITNCMSFWCPGTMSANGFCSNDLFGHIFRAHGVPSRWRSSHDCKPPWRLTTEIRAGREPEVVDAQESLVNFAGGALLVCPKLCLSLMFVWCWK